MNISGSALLSVRRWLVAGLSCLLMISTNGPSVQADAGAVAEASASDVNVVVGVADPTASPDEWDLLSIGNWFRAHAGGYDDGSRLPALRWDAALAETSQHHVDYLEYLRSVGSYYCGHGEDPNHPADAFGDRHNDVVFCGLPLPEATEGWLATPLHGGPFLNPTTTHVGGASSGNISAAAFAWDWNAAPSQPYVFPAPNGVMPLTTWLGKESPDPTVQCPSVGNVRHGEPISLFMPKSALSGTKAGRSIHYVYRSHELRRSDGVAVPSCFFGWDSIRKAGETIDPVENFIFPQQPFINGGRYGASVRLTPVYDDGTSGKDIELSWSFDVVDYRYPANIRAELLQDGRVKLTWDPPVRPDQSPIGSIYYTIDDGKTERSVSVPGRLSDGQVILSGLPKGTRLRVRPSRDAPWSNEVASAVAITPIAPARLADTRSGSHTVDGRGAATGRVTDKGVLRVSVSGRGGVPSGAKAAVVNLTPVGASGPGYVTAWSCDGSVPLASSANYSPADGVNPNLAVVPLNSQGEMCIFTLRAADLVVDVTGYVAPGSGAALTPLAPRRLADTRSGAATVDGKVAGVGRVGDRGVLRVPVTGRAGVPKGARAALVNLTPVGAADPGFVTAWSCDGVTPLASSANYSPGDGANPNLALVPLNARGEMCLYSLRSVDLVVDVTGYVASATVSELSSVVPARLADTRKPDSTVDGRVAGSGRVADGGVLRVPVAGRGLVPAGARAVVVNITPVGVAGPGFATAWSCDGATPLASSANYSPNDGANPNLALVPLNSKGEMCIYTLRSAHLVVDVTGFVATD